MIFCRTHCADAQGEPYGLLLDAAGDLAFQAAYAPHESLSDGDYAGLVSFGLEAMAHFRHYVHYGRPHLLEAWIPRNLESTP